VNGRHQFKRQFVRLKGWLTLGSIGILPRLVIAFASVGALAATANLIVEKGVAILEQQRNVAQERSALDARQIFALRESMGRARHAAMSSEVLGALSDFDRATQEHADADSRASADEGLTLLDALVGQLLAFFRCLDAGYHPDSPSEQSVITRVVSGFEIHRREAAE